MKTLVVFSHLRWTAMLRSPQPLMRALARRYRIIFIEEPRPTASGARMRLEEPQDGIERIVPLTEVHPGGFHDEQPPWLQATLERHIVTHSPADRIFWLATPMALPLISRLRRSLLVYDCDDDLGVLDGSAWPLRRREAALLQHADIVLARRPCLYETLRLRHPHVYCLPNSAGAERQAPAPAGAAPFIHRLLETAAPELGHEIAREAEREVERRFAREVSAGVIAAIAAARRAPA